jgi:hypothetical protein
MATARHNVSLVVVPRYLEADTQLEDRVQHQSALVTGGIVLGQAPTLPEDTRTLLRQLIYSPDRLEQLVNLTSPLGLAIAIIGLLGLGVAAAPAAIESVSLMVQVAANINEHAADARKRRTEKRKGDKVTENPDRPSSPPAGEDDGLRANDDWVLSLRGEEVTIWLRSGPTVTGVVERLQGTVVHSERDLTKRWSNLLPARPNDNHATEMTVLRISNARLMPGKDGEEQAAELVLVPLGRIELIVERSHARHHEP